MKIKHGIAFLLGLSFAGIGLTHGYARSRGANAPPVTPSSPAAPALITTAHPQRRSFTREVPWIGVVESRASVELTAPVAGRVTRIAAGDQDRIERGRLVMRLGGPRIEGQRAVARAGIQSLESQLRLARQTAERLERSLKTQLATRDQVAQAREAQIRLKTRLRKARLSLKILDSQVRISAPMAGIFTNRRVSRGQDVTAGEIIGEIIDTGRLRIAAAIFPPPGITLQGKPAAIDSDATRVLTGFVSRVLPRASSSGAVRIWIQCPQMDGRLRPGQAVAGILIAKAVSDTLAVPRSAIVYDAREQPLLFVRKDGAYAAQHIRLGLMQDGWVQVLGGLEQDQLVAVQGAYELYYRHFNDQFKVED
jgi:cobalt-zinc-cadmium efflux system membrane fusion protein